MILHIVADSSYLADAISFLPVTPLLKKKHPVQASWTLSRTSYSEQIVHGPYAPLRQFAEHALQELGGNERVAQSIVCILHGYIIFCGDREEIAPVRRTAVIGATVFFPGS